MSFLWPSAFAALASIPLLILLYLWAQRRRRRIAVRYSSLALVRAALPAQSRLRRYLPMALYFLALASLVVSLARPVAAAQVPAGRATVMLALDVSTSMTQSDISPSRLGAAKHAALEFIDKQKATNQVGIVAFASSSQLVQTPSRDPDKLAKAIRSLTTGRGTAIGSGILTALDAIDQFGQGGGASSTAPGAGQYEPDIIVVLTDGMNNAGVDPVRAAQRAANSGVRVYTIGFGTQAGARGGGAFGRFGGFDEAALERIASMTGGSYYAARSAGELQTVFDSLPTILVTREETVELGVLSAALAALLVTSALLLSQLWHPLP